MDSRVWSALIDAGVFITNADGVPFTFATGRRSRLKVDAERLQKDPINYGVILGLLATHECVYSADTLAYVPDGMADAAERIGALTGKDVIRMKRIEGGGRYDYAIFEEDGELLAEVRAIALLEDVSSTGSSAHAAAKLLRSVNPGADIHSLSMLQRGPVSPDYEKDLVYHTLCYRDVPDTPEALLARYNIVAERV